MIKSTKIIIAVISALAIILIIACSWWLNLTRPVSLGKPAELTIETGEGSAAIAQKLQTAGLIKSASAFKLYAALDGEAKKFKAGHYVFGGLVTYQKISDSLLAGDKVGNTIKITIPEGWTSKEIDAYLAKNNKFDAGEFSAAINEASSNALLKNKFSFLDSLLVAASLEGYLFPDTYSIYKTAAVDEVIQKMLANFDRKLRPEWRAEIERQGKSIFQIVTMASIIEKEVRKQEDMKIVSDIFWRRIGNEQRLESCATLAYILGVNKSQYTLQDTEVDSPYNTYRNKGLPPGPISNPGASAIEAAIYPQANKFNFFLTASGSGETIYSRTFEEHVLNKNKYLK